MKYQKTSKFVDTIFQTPDNTGSWFGYYNYDTLNRDQTRMLSHRTKNDAQAIQKGMMVELGYYEIPSGLWHTFGVSDSYSWQQGSMLQWLPGEGNENKVIYNLSKDNHLISRIQDVETGKYQDINWSIYGITPDGKKSIALDMERSYWCRAYHYESVANEAVNMRVAPNDGIFEIDLVNNTRKLLIPIDDIIAVDKEAYFDTAKHWLEHIMISPSGKRFCFLHRFTIGTLDEYETRLFVADIDGSNLQLIPDWRIYYFSHFGWDGDDAFAIYAYELHKHQKVLAKYETANCKENNLNEHRGLRQKKGIIASLKNIVPQSIRTKIWKMFFYKPTPQYYKYYNLQNNIFVASEDFNESLLSIDGHPSFTKDGKYMITDSYPDKDCYQRLIVYNTHNKQSALMGKIYAGLYGKSGSCDLHPKLCVNNDFLVVDSAFNGQHHMILFKLNWNLIKNKIG